MTPWSRHDSDTRSRCAAQRRSPTSHGAGRSMSVSRRLPEVVAMLRREDPAAERDRVLQYEAVESIRRTGVLNLRVPTEFGGPGGKARDVLSAVIQIGRGSSNVAQALRSHFGFSERLLSNRATRRPKRRSGSRGSMPGSSSATPSPMRRAGPRRAPIPRCCPTPMECCGSTATSSIPPARCSPTSSRCPRSTPKAAMCRRSFRQAAAVSNCSTTGTDSASGRLPAGDAFHRCRSQAARGRHRVRRQHTRACDRVPSAVSGRGGGGHRLRGLRRCGRICPHEGTSGLAFGRRHAQPPTRSCCRPSERSRPQRPRPRPSC